MSHLGHRVSSLLDGQLSPQETERCWHHVHTCHFCRDQVEREGWVKTRLQGWSMGGVDSGGASPDLKSGLKAGLGSGLGSGLAPGDYLLALAQQPAPPRRVRRVVGLAALGGSAAGAAVMGVLALGTAPADAPTIDRRPPSASVLTPLSTPAKLPTGARR